MGFKMIYWTPISSSYFLKGSILEKCGFYFKNGRFSGRIWPDWGNTARADMAGLGSKGLNTNETAVFPGGYGRIGEILHRRVWPDWGLKG